jgi:phosphoribosylglycinamide formyltransferase-1
MKKIVIITSDSLRHRYLRHMFMASKNIQIQMTYIENKSLDYMRQISFEDKLDDIEKIHFELRFAVEDDFFSEAKNLFSDPRKTVYLAPKEINSDPIVYEIQKLNPDLIVAYGCSIIKPKLLELFKDRIINVHLGLSPYYFGAATNFHAMVEGDFQCVGYTFMYMDAGVDTGEIIHQRRAKIYPFDNPHTIGNRLIKDMASDFVSLVENFDKVTRLEQFKTAHGKLFKIKDATKERTELLYKNLKKGALDEYLGLKREKESLYPILEQQVLL